MSDTVLRLGVDSRPAEEGSRRVTRSLDAMRARARAAADSFDKMKDEMKGFQRAGEAMTSVGTKLTTFVTLPLVALGAVSVKASADMDALRRALIAVAGSASEADKQIAGLQQVAKLPGLGYEEAVKGSIAFQALKVSASEAERVMTAFGKAIARSGGGKEDLEAVVRQLTQVIGKGKISGEELTNIAERVPVFRQAILDAFGTLDTELLNSRMSARKFVEGVTTELMKLEGPTGGLKNAFENMGDTIKRAAATIGDQLAPVVVAVTGRMSTLLEKVTSLNPETLRWAIAIGAVAAVAGPLLITLGGITIAISAMLPALALLTKALGIGLLPLIGVGGGIAIGLGVIAGLFVKLGLDAAAAAADMEAATQRMHTAISGLTDAIAKQNRVTSEHNLNQFDTAITQQLDHIEAQRALVERLGPGRAKTDAKDVLDVQERNLEVLRGQRAEHEKIADAYEADAKRRATVVAPPKPDLPAGTKKGKTALELLDEEISRLGELAEMGRLTQGEQARIIALESDLNRQLERGVSTQARRLEILKQISTLEGARRVQVDQRIEAVAAGRGRGTTVNDTLANTGVKVDAIVDPIGPAPVLAYEGDNRGSSIMGGAKVIDAFTDSLESAGNQMKFAAGDVLANFSPLGMAAAVLGGLFEHLQPVLDALMVPIQMVGELLGTVLTPVIKALFPPMKLVATGLSYIVSAIGYFVKAIGKVIDKIPGLSDFGLKKAGQTMIDSAKETRDALKGLTFEDAVARVNGEVDKIANAVTDIPKAVNLMLYRSRLTGGTTGTTGSTTYMPPAGGVPGGGTVVFEGGIHVTNNAGDTPEQFARKMEAAAQHLRSRGGALYLPGAQVAPT